LDLRLAAPVSLALRVNASRTRVAHLQGAPAEPRHAGRPAVAKATMAIFPIRRSSAMSATSSAVPSATLAASYTRGAQLPALLKARILILDGAMGTMIQRYKLDEAAYRG
jgi:hypothetical protein